MFLDAEEAEIRGSVGMLHGAVPLVDPIHGYGDGKSGLDADVHVAASGGGMVDAAGVKTSGLEWDGLGIGGNPPENAVLPERERGEGAEKDGEDG
jgi:hypothetical protein